MTDPTDQLDPIELLRQEVAMLADRVQDEELKNAKTRLELAEQLQTILSIQNNMRLKIDNIQNLAQALKEHHNA